MKRLAIALSVVTGLSVGAGQSASAADLPMKAPPMVAAPVPFSWTGFYVGGHVGTGWGTATAFDLTDGSVAGSGNVSGLLGGFQAGYNYQINWLVLGIEGDFSFANVNGSAAGGFIGLGGGTGSAKFDRFSTLTGRFGGTVDHALLYVKGGAAWAHAKYSVGGCGVGEPVFGADFEVPNCESFSGGKTVSGWTLGAGIEYAFTRNWSGKLEYDYMDFGTKMIGVSDADETWSANIQQRIHAVKAGVNYRFDWGR
jgi:outer membrane immunogenic protein